MHFREKITIVDNFFKNPNQVINLSKDLKYHKHENYSGVRSDNILYLNNPSLTNFGLFFCKKLANEIFFGIKKINIDIRFHKNTCYQDDTLNQGWIHSDNGQLAGLVYLNEKNINPAAGTSIFDKKTNDNFSTNDFESRKKFNFHNLMEEDYKKDLINNHNNFVETINISNKFNRFVAYDASLWHRPNNYKLFSNDCRLTLLFFIESFDLPNFNFLSHINTTWKDI